MATLGHNRSIQPSFSVSKYGAQCDVDPYDNDAGDGLKPDCSTDQEQRPEGRLRQGLSPKTEQKWIKHLVKTWGKSSNGGVGYYLMDNEPSIWFSTHRDVHPVGPHADEYRDKVIAESAQIKGLDPSAQIVAPEEWGWEAYFYSGYDQQYAADHGYTKFPDHKKRHGMDYIPWLLSEWKKAGHPVDVLSVHFYPQAGEYGNDTSDAMQLLRNRSTRQLWDPNYISESWINAPVYLIPRLKGWISDDYYASTPTAITEYNWGAENHINGATTQARTSSASSAAKAWTWLRAGPHPMPAHPRHKAMQMYRNYDSAGSSFGDTSVSATPTG